MKQEIVFAFENYQKRDYDNDIVGISISLVEFMNLMKRLLGKEDNVYEKLYDVSENVPHFPKYQIRKNLRKFFAHLIRPKEEYTTEDLQSIYNTVLCAFYCYSLPIEQLMEERNLTRKKVEEILLEKGMSENLLKEPSDVDYSAVLL